MSEKEREHCALDEVSYPGLRQCFRGPSIDPDQPFVAVLGGSEVCAKHLDTPFSVALAKRTGRPVANLGVDSGGLTALEASPGLLQFASRAEVAVLQITGAPNLSNRLYMVHSRRNDRFLSASSDLEALYPDVDFTDYAFTGHLLQSLKSRSADAFATVIAELRIAWRERMRAVLEQIDTKVVLLWMSPRTPEGDPMADPAFVDRAMIEELRPHVAAVVEVVEGGPTEHTDSPSAARRLDAAMHRRTAEALARAIASATEKRPRRAGAISQNAVMSQSFSVSSGTASKRSATRP